jgi:hypothetical protein
VLFFEKTKSINKNSSIEQTRFGLILESHTEKQIHIGLYKNIQFITQLDKIATKTSKITIKQNNKG